MDSELEETIDLVGTLTIDDVGGPLTAERIAILLEAARKVANPDIEAATAITYELRYIKDDDEWDDEIGDITKRAIFAALGITEGTR